MIGQPVRSRFNSNFVSTTTVRTTTASTEGNELFHLLEGIDVDLYRPHCASDLTLKPRQAELPTVVAEPMDIRVETRRNIVVETATTIQTTTSSSSSVNEAVLETPKRFQFVREPMTTSRIPTGKQLVQSPATAELEGEMELERIDEEFSTPMGRSRIRRTEAASAPVRRNPRRSTRNKY